MVVALIALFVSLAGNATAVTVLVSSRQIKDNSIQISDIAPAARESLRGNQGPQGPRGMPGPRGLQGPQGPAGISFDASEIEEDLQELCKGIKGTQREVDDLNSELDRYAAFWLPDFTWSQCSYSHYYYD
jgi:hypothetical protein